MKKWALGIIIFLSVTFTIGISSVNAQSYPDIDNVNLTNISSLNYSTNYYIVGYDLQPDLGQDWRYYLIFFRTDGGYIELNDGSDYQNEICSTYTSTGQNGCFSRVNGNRSGTTSIKLSSVYTSTDGTNWIYENNSHDLYNFYTGNSYIIKSTTWIRPYSGVWVDVYENNFVLDLGIFNVDFEQGDVILKGSGATANLVSYYIEPKFDNFVPDNYIFSYIENTTGGGFRDSHQFYLTYSENGISYNGKTYHYYYNLPLSYNTGLTFSINDLDNNLIQENQFTAYLSSLTDISGYTMYDFKDYEFANMSYINTGSFGLSYQLNTNITINAINYNTNTKIDFLSSSYLINSNTDNNGVTWYEFNFNNDPIYLEFINNFNDSSDFYTYLDTYNLYLYFDNNAFVHLSGSPVSIDGQDNIVNQQAYKDSQGNIIYNNNPIVINIDNSNEFFQNLQRYFKDFDTDTFGLTGIITSPLNLIQNLLSNTCNPLVVPIPYINTNLSLPCMNTIYSQYFGGFYVIYQDITFGIVAYWVIVRILNMVKDFRNPDHDEIEVLDL